MLGTSKNIWGFDPRSVPGCALWLDGADSNSMTLSGSNVTAWTDKSPLATAFTLSNGSGGSTIRTTYIGLPVVQVSNSCFFNGSYSYPLATRSIFFVMAETVHSDWRGLLSFASNADQSDYNTQNGYTITATNTVGSNVQFSQNFGNGGFNFNYNASNGTKDVPFQLYEDVTSNTAVTLFITGSNVYSSNTSVTPLTSTGLTVGGRNGIPNTGALVIAEVLLYSNVLTTSQRQQVEGYLSHKWGLNGYYDSSIPLSIPGCQLWLDGADPAGTGVQPSNGATVSTWVDKSGNGYNATAAPSRTAGTYSTSFRAVNFPTSTTGYITSYSAAPTNETMFVVFNNPSASFYNNILIGGVQGARSLGAAYSGKIGNSSVVGNLNTQVDWLANVGTYTLGTTALVTSQFTTSTNTISLNGGTAGSGGAPGFTAGRVTYLGVDATNGSFYYIGYAMEIIFYNSILNTTQRQSIEGYLARKWGLTSMYSALPSIHPFSSIRPHLRTFQPTDIPGCQLWLDGADSSTITLGTGSSVESWRDKVNGYAVANSSAAYRPIYSQGTIRFNGITSTSFLDIPTLTIGSSAFSIFFVMQNTGPASGNAYAPHFFWPLSGNGSGALSMTGWLNTNIQGINANTVSTLLKNQYYVISYTFGVTTNFEQVYANGASIGTYQKSSGYSASLYRIGAINTASTETSLDGNIGEMLVYNTALTTSQRQQVEGYLAHKWGLTTPIPSTHPFKSILPAKAPMIIGLVNRWIFNNGSGSTVTDTVGGQNISLSGTYTWSSSVPNSEIALGSLSFNGYSGTGSASVNATLQTTTYTMTLWYYHTGVSDPYGGNPMILQSGFNQNEAFSFATGGFTGTSKPYFYSGVYNGGFGRTFSSATPLNTWTHLAVTIGNSTYNAYQNGVLDSGNTNISITSGLPLTLNGSFIFAKGDSAYGNRFGGSLFDVRIYNRALSASEISQIYNGIG